MTQVERRRKPRVTLQEVEVIDLARLAHLEASSYPPDEAASALDLEYRAAVARELCCVAFREGCKEFVGFVVGTAAPEGTTSITKEIVRNHHASGNVLCIHSVVIEARQRRQGLGTAMMDSYLDKIRAHTGIQRILLLSKSAMVPFYQRLGFSVIGESTITLGSGSWIEMGMDVK